MSAADVLVKARELIAEPARWTTGGFARDRRGDSTDWLSPTATCWCAAGAIAAVDVVPGWRSEAVGALAHEAGVARGNVGVFNDSHSHAEVIALFDRTIARLRAEEPEP